MLFRPAACAFLLIGSAQAQQCPSLVAEDPAFARVIALTGKAQRNELRRLMATDNQRGFINSVFYYGERLRPALLSLVADRDHAGYAVELLALIGEPEDLRRIIKSPPRAGRDALSFRWAYQVASSLLDPSSEEDWSFLRRCALHEYENPWADTGAIQTLKLIASPRAREILEEAQNKNTFQQRSLSNPLQYIDSNPAALAGMDLISLSERIAQTISPVTWKGNGMPRCNEKQDQALINFNFETDEDLYFYSATFHKTSDAWKLRGLRETAQALKMHRP